MSALLVSLWDVVDDPKLTPAQRFELFHEKNPQVYEELKSLALDLVDLGHVKIGIAMLWEVLRWQHAMRTRDDQGYKLNNDYRAPYARLLMKNDSRLAGVFEIRKSHCDGG